MWSVIAAAAAVAGGGDDVEVAGAVGVVDVAVGAGGVGADIEPEPEFEFDVGVMMFGIEVVDELEVTKEEEVDEETVDTVNGVECVGEGPDIVVVAAVAAAGVEVVGIDAFARYIVDADIGEEAEDYVEAASAKRS